MIFLVFQEIEFPYTGGLGAHCTMPRVEDQSPFTQSFAVAYHQGTQVPVFCHCPFLQLEQDVEF